MSLINARLTKSNYHIHLERIVRFVTEEILMSLMTQFTVKFYRETVSLFFLCSNGNELAHVYLI